MWIENCTQGTMIAHHVLVADCFWKRLKGLLGTKSLALGHGLIITPCSSVHTFGMAYPIDILFVSQDHQIIKIIHGMTPGRVIMQLRSSYVVELPVGTAKQAMCLVGDHIKLK